jgi:hypothetical protein
MDAKLTEIIGINKVNINPRYPALNAIFTRLFLKNFSLFLSCYRRFAPADLDWIIYLSEGEKKPMRE